MIRRFFLKRLKNYFTILMIPAFVLFVFILFMTASSRIHNIHTASQNALENMDEKLLMLKGTIQSHIPFLFICFLFFPPKLEAVTSPQTLGTSLSPCKSEV